MKDLVEGNVSNILNGDCIERYLYCAVEKLALFHILDELMIKRAIHRLVYFLPLSFAPGRD
jgi:hypothetical protein